jgi:cholest-4-en-3-one 26-monooxygenase
MMLSSVNLSDPETYRSGMPYEAFRQLRHQDPVSWREDNTGEKYWAVTRYHDVVAVLHNPQYFSSWRKGSLIADPPPHFLEKMREGMLHRDPPGHTALRRPANKAFTPKRIAHLEQRIAHHATFLIDRMLEREECDFAKEIAAEMPVFVICEILGVPLEDRQRLTALTERMLESPIADREAAMRDTMAAVGEMRAYGAELGRKKRASPADDFVSDMVGSQDGQLTDGEFEALFLLLFNAGSDTTRGLLCFGLDMLLDRPELMAALREQPARWPSAIEEMLRYESPVIQFRRTATFDTELGGKKIKEGDKVVLFFPSANRDESVFKDPDVLDIDRSQNDHLSFGQGTHFCLGATLARLEAKHMFQQLFTRLKMIERRGPLVVARSNFVRGVRQLNIRFSA